MHYSRLVLRNFRSYKKKDVELDEGVTIVVGPNASGKTNLLEAVLVISQGSSYRVKDSGLITFGENEAKISAELGDEKRQISISEAEGNTQKNMSINDQQIKRITLDRKVPTVLFEPEHLRLISGSPELRREFIDSILSSTMPGYKQLLRSYKRALAQRNRLLKINPSNLQDQIFIWDVKLSEAGALINENRRRIISETNDHIGDIYNHLAQKEEKVSLRYQATVTAKDYASQLLKGLSDNLESDQIKGFTSLGVHRDDILFYLNNNRAESSASRGEIRTLLLASKLSEVRILENELGKKPILLFDDVFSELDETRRQGLVQYLRGYQTIITTTNADVISKKQLKNFSVIKTS